MEVPDTDTRDDSSDTSSTEEEEEDEDLAGLESLLGDLKEQMHQIYTASTAITQQVQSVYSRAKHETTDWMTEPLKTRSALRPWLESHGLPTKPTLHEFLDACFAAATSVDLETRVMTFRREDAALLWNGQTRITVFDMIAAIPTLFA
jgi:hypothetical protein